MVDHSFRHIAPGPSPPSDGGSPPREYGASGNWKKRVSTACLACKKSKRKCSGEPPCDNCRAFNRVCIFDESLDQRRRVAAKRTVDELNYHRDLLNDLFRVIRSEDESHARRLLDLIRGEATAGQIRAFIDDTLVAMGGLEQGQGPGPGQRLGQGLGPGPGAVQAPGQPQAAQQQQQPPTQTQAPTAATATAPPTQQKQNQNQNQPDRTETLTRLQDIRQLITMEGTNPSLRRKVMDIHYICDDAPFKVPARPWTSVTEDDDLVSHLISLYFTWDYPVYSFLDREVFVRHMKGVGSTGGGSTGSGEELCSGFLVNALLSCACHFSEFSEAYVVPGDLMTKGTDFLSEAERLREIDESKGVITLPLLQGMLLLSERYSMSKNDDLGYTMLHRAIKMGEELGLINDHGHGHPRSSTNRGVHEGKSEDMAISMQRTAWGLFEIDTIVHTGFLRRNLINRVNTPPPRKTNINTNTNTSTNANSGLWVPYPSHRAARPAHLNQYLEQSRGLSEIARDVSRRFFAVAEETGAGKDKDSGKDSSRDSSKDSSSTKDSGSKTEQARKQRERERERDRERRRHRQARGELYESLRRWEEGLPGTFDLSQSPPPYIILLRMRYHTLTINLFSASSYEEREEEKAEAEAAEAAEKAEKEKEKQKQKDKPPTTPNTTTTTITPTTPESEVSSSSSSSSNNNPNTTPTPTHQNTKPTPLTTIPLNSARSISTLTRLHRREYGMTRAHHFALYAINLALYAFLESPSFNILDDDFLSLTSAFSVVASRSPLGRNLFHIFRQSVRAKRQGCRVRGVGRGGSGSAAGAGSGGGAGGGTGEKVISQDLRELFDEEMDGVRTRWDEYALGLEKLDEDVRYHGLYGSGAGGGGEEGDETEGGTSEAEGSTEGATGTGVVEVDGESEGGSDGHGHGHARKRRHTNLQELPGLGLFDMLDRYESLSLGKDELLGRRFDEVGR